MADVSTTKSTSMPPAKKSFMTDGPTLHYSHVNVHAFWGLTVLVFLVGCYFWNRIMSGGIISVDFNDFLDPALFRLGMVVVNPISIYEYPWQILVLGTLMGVLAVGPVLVSQLLNFRYSIPLLLAIFFLAKLYLFSVFVLISCIAVACRPLRFRSRFISLALCMAPQVLYWAIWGGYPTLDAVRWGFSFSPWICAWLCGLAMAGLILGIGHFIRYKPGLIWLGCGLLITVSFVTFQVRIGFAELDYQRYVANNNPEDVPEFHDHRITETLERIIEDDTMRSKLMGELYPIEPIMLREKLKEDLQNLLPLGYWTEEFIRKMPPEFNFQIKRQKLLLDYDEFMNRWPNSSRMPTAMYFRALLQEYRPDVRYLVSQENLRFYNDYPFPSNLALWNELFKSFPESPESHEARWRIANNLAGQGKFETARNYIEFSLGRLPQLLETGTKSESEKEPDLLSEAFGKAHPEVMSPFKLRDLLGRFQVLYSHISDENMGTDAASKDRLQRFIMLNPYDGLYESHLDTLLQEMPADDGLRDNILLAKALLINDLYERSQALTKLIETYPQHDAGIRAVYDLALIKVQLWKYPQNSDDVKQQLLQEAEDILTGFIEAHPNNPHTEQARVLLESLMHLN